MFHHPAAGRTSNTRHPRFEPSLNGMQASGPAQRKKEKKNRIRCSYPPEILLEQNSEMRKVLGMRARNPTFYPLEARRDSMQIDVIRVVQAVPTLTRLRGSSSAAHRRIKVTTPKSYDRVTRLSRPSLLCFSTLKTTRHLSGRSRMPRPNLTLGSTHEVSNIHDAI